MTEQIPLKHHLVSPEAQKRIQKRYQSERRFQFYGKMALVLAIVFLGILIVDIVKKALPAFSYHAVQLSLDLKKEELDPNGTTLKSELLTKDYAKIIRTALYERFANVTDRKARRQLLGLISTGSDSLLRQHIIENPKLIGQKITWSVLLSDDADLAAKGHMTKEKTFEFSQKLEFDTQNPNVLKASSDVFGSFYDNIKKQKAAALRAVEANLLANKNKLASIAVPNADAPEVEKQKFAQFTSAIQTAISGFEEEIKVLNAAVLDSANGIELFDSDPSLLIDVRGGVFKVQKLTPNQVTGQILVPFAEGALTEKWSFTVLSTPEKLRKISDQEMAWLRALKSNNEIVKKTNWPFLSSSDSREPEMAGIWGGLIGSAFMMLVTISIALPLGVGAAIYLEEFAVKNKFTDLIETNINNLAAVPSIVFGLLGLQMFLNIFELPRSAPLVGGLVLALLILPTIIIASRTALRSIPPSIREAALGVGATHQQAVFHHVLPLAMPGIMTGTIIGLAHALGETAPLLMIGMVAFVVDIPTSITDAATALPVQIFLWADLPEEAFKAKTASAILVLLAFLVFMNSIAVYLRKKFERKW